MSVMALISITLTMAGFGGGIALGILAGYFMFIHFEPDDVKEPLLANLSTLDFKALQELVPEIPFWVKSPDYEKVDWLNKFAQEIWPYMNKAVCKIIQESAEPYIAEYKPKFNLETVEFESLTLGTLPPVFMGVKILDTQEKELIFEVSAKFAGNPDIKLAVKAYGLTAVAQLVDAQVFANARITLTPLVSAFPCFSRIYVSLLEKPHVDFGLKIFNTDLMAIPLLDKYVQDDQHIDLLPEGLEVVTLRDSIYKFSDFRESIILGIIKQTVASMYLWPNKLEVPILSHESVSKSVQGVLVVTVLRCKQLRNKDILGLSDPYVRLTVADSIQKTKVIMNNLNPEWNETFSLIVNDPEADTLDIAVYDWDQVGGHDKLGIQCIPLKQLNPDNKQTFSLNLLKSFDQNDQANKKNRGQITLELEYKPFDGNEEEDELENLSRIDSEGRTSIPKSGTVSFDPSSVTITPLAPSTGGGLLLVKVHKAENVEGKGHTNPYVKIIFRGEKRRSKVIKRNRDPRWEAEFEFVLDDSPLQDHLLVEIKSKGTGIIHYRVKRYLHCHEEQGTHVGAVNQESLGHVEINLADVVRNRRINEKYQLLDSKYGKVQVELQWRSTGALSLRRNATGLQGYDKPRIDYSGPIAEEKPMP